MLRAGGHLVGSDPEGIVDEADTFTCRHCQKIVVVRPKQRPEDIGGLCRICMGLVCPGCAGGGCQPFERRIEAAEARGRLRRDLAAPP